jgi:hypothetical protein
VERAGIDKSEVSETILGPGPDRRAGPEPRAPGAYQRRPAEESAAWGINQVCGSGLRAVALGAQHIQLGDAASWPPAGRKTCRSPPCRASARRPQDGRHEVHRHDDPRRPVGRLQRLSHGPDRRERRREMADQPRHAGRIRRRLPEQGRSRPEGRQVRRRDRAFTVKTRKGDIVVDKDEYIRHGATIEAMQKLRPAFTKDGSVTAANASGINDGAAGDAADERGRGRKRGHRAAGAHRLLRHRRSRPVDHGRGPDPRLAQGAGKGRLEGRRPRPGRGQRGLRRAGLRREQGHGLGSGDRERERRRHRHRPPDRRLGLPRAQHAAVRDEAPRRQEGPRHAVHRRRHGRRHVRRTP